MILKAISDNTLIDVSKVEAVQEEMDFRSGESVLFVVMGSNRYKATIGREKLLKLINEKGTGLTNQYTSV